MAWRALRPLTRLEGFDSRIHKNFELADECERLKVIQTRPVRVLISRPCLVFYTTVGPECIASKVTHSTEKRWLGATMSRETRNIKSVEGRTRLNNVLIKALIAVALIVADGSAIAIRFASAVPTPSRSVSSPYEAAIRPLIAVPPSVAFGAIEVTLSSHQSPPSNSATLAAWAGKNGPLDNTQLRASGNMPSSCMGAAPIKKAPGFSSSLILYVNSLTARGPGVTQCGQIDFAKVDGASSLDTAKLICPLGSRCGQYAMTVRWAK